MWSLFSLFHLLLVRAITGPSLQQMSSFPVRLPSTVNSSAQTCPSQDAVNAARTKVRSILDEIYATPLCTCGGDGGWTRVAYLNMSDPNQQCPSNWNITTSPVRGCGRSSAESNTCDSSFYPVLGRTYSSVCGRVLAYRRGLSLGFYAALATGRNTIDAAYVSGVSVTHGPAGSRKHIWTFVAAMGEHLSYYGFHKCPCTNTNVTWPYQVPSFIGNDYFCDSGNHGSRYITYIYFPDDPLWDGEGCGSASTCCEYNTPPWFCKSLPQPTSDDLELRLCNYHNFDYNEDKLISLVEIFIK